MESTYDAENYLSRRNWEQALSASSVRIQWDPHRSLSGSPLKRKAIQLGLRSEVLREYTGSAVVAITDISSFVSSQRGHVEAKNYSAILLPGQRVYRPAEPRPVHVVPGM